MRVALLGARGQIGRGLVSEFARAHAVSGFAGTASDGAQRYAAFPDGEFDIVVNAAGPGDPLVLREPSERVFRLTESFDNLVLDYLEDHPDTLYVFLSTGAIYLNGYATVAGPDSTCVLPVNQFDPARSYPLAKLYAETKHRAASRFNIADIRIFGYFSRHVPLHGGFFLSAVANAILARQTFTTTSRNFIRDYVGASDIVRLVECIARHGRQNQAYDLVSAAPVSKAAMLAALTERFGLRVEYDDASVVVIDDAVPPRSLSEYDSTRRVGYAPAQTSLDIVLREMQALVNHSSFPAAD